MQDIKIVSFIVIGVLAIDYAIRLSVQSSKDSPRFKSAGILALLVICLTETPRQFSQKGSVLKQLMLSMIMVSFLMIANYFLLLKGIPENANVLQFGLILAPVLVIPFCHFLFELLLIHPLSIDGILASFHQRGIHALILSANILFISLDPLQNIVSVIGHFIMVFLALLGCFYLSSRHRKSGSTYDFFYEDNVEYLEPSTIRYLAALLEFLYYLLLTYCFFLEGPKKILLADLDGLWAYGLFSGLLLMLVSGIVKYRFYLNTPFTIAFYEDRVLPLSFLMFGVVTVFLNLLN